VIAMVLQSNVTVILSWCTLHACACRFESGLWLKSGINGHLKVFNSIATKYYRAASEAVWNNYMRVPALVLVSENDRIGTSSANQKLTRVWRDLGIDVTFKSWDKSAHVQHLPKHPKEYEALLDKFLNKININTNSINF